MSAQPQDVQTILNRIEVLERQNRWLMRGALIGLLLAVAAVTMGQAPLGRTIEAQGFILRDSSGNKRAELALLESGPAIRFFDTRGNVTALLSANTYTIFGNGTRTLKADSGSVDVPIQRMSLNDSGLFFTDRHGKAIITLGGISDLKAMTPARTLQMFDENEKVRVEMNGRSDNPKVSVLDATGQASADLNHKGRPFILSSRAFGPRNPMKMGRFSTLRPVTAEKSAFTFP